MGGDIIRSETTKCLAAENCNLGYNPIEAELESVCVESEIFDGLTSLRFTRHFQENVEMTRATMSALMRLLNSGLCPTTLYVYVIATCTAACRGVYVHHKL